MLPAIRIAWKAAPLLLLASILQRMVAAALYGTLLVVGQSALTHLTSNPDQITLAGTLPTILTVAAIISLLPLMTLAARETGRLLSKKVRRQVDEQVLAVATGVELSVYEDADFHDQLQRVSRESQFAPVQLIDGLLGVIGSVGGIIVVSGVLGGLKPWLPLVVLAASIPVVVTSSRAANISLVERVTLTPAERERDYLRNTMTSASMAKEMRALHLGPHFAERFATLYSADIAANELGAWRRLLLGAIGAVMAAAVLAAIIAGFVGATAAGILSFSEFGTSLAAIFILSQQLFAASSYAVILSESGGFMYDLDSFLRRRSEPTRANAYSATPSIGRLVVDNVSFQYPSTRRQALQGVSLSIEPGQVIALVGENGSGKSTLAKLLARLYVPTAGNITWDGKDTSHMAPAEVRRLIGVVFQDFGRFAIDAEENIRIGRVDRRADLSAVKTAAADAGVDAVLAALDRGYQTVLSSEFENGTDLSLGQWQKVALARAFYRDAPLLILDEPTSGLDANAEHDLFERVQDLCRNRTVLLISHRLSSVRSADKIFVLDQGRLIEQGTHEELMSQGGRYAQMYALQAESYQFSRTE